MYRSSREVRAWMRVLYGSVAFILFIASGCIVADAQIAGGMGVDVPFDYSDFQQLSPEAFVEEYFDMLEREYQADPSILTEGYRIEVVPSSNPQYTPSVRTHQIYSELIRSAVLAWGQKQGYSVYNGYTIEQVLGDTIVSLCYNESFWGPRYDKTLEQEFREHNRLVYTDETTATAGECSIASTRFGILHGLLSKEGEVTGISGRQLREECEKKMSQYVQSGGESEEEVLDLIRSYCTYYEGSIGLIDSKYGSFSVSITKSQEAPGIVGNLSLAKNMLNDLLSYCDTQIGAAKAAFLEQLREQAASLEPSEEGVSFLVLAEKDGYVSASLAVDTGDTFPSSITVTGKVVDAQGNPVQLAKVSIASLKVTGVTDATGQFSLSAETEGDSPFSTSLTLTLQTPTSGVTVTFENQEPLPVSEDSTIRIVAKDDRGEPVREGRVALKWTLPDFVTMPVTEAKLDSDGTLIVPIQVELPSNLGTMPLESSSLQVKVEVKVTPDDGGESGSAALVVPLNLSVITGTTVGPDMKPRPEKNPPSLSAALQSLVVGRWEDDSGKFRLLVYPFHPLKHEQPKEWGLAWSAEDRLPLEFPMLETPQPGEVMDVGLIDVLTPDEHMNRIRQVAAEFFAAMPLTALEQSKVQNALRRVVFVDGGVSDVPYFTDNFTDDSGIIHIPGTATEYWRKNLNVDNDAAYEIIPHELGHFVHHNMVEQFSYINMCYNKLSTGTHTTWATEPGQLPVKLPYISFSESTADFFAVLFRDFWEARHPEIKDSPYFKRLGYLQEFENDEKAMDVLARLEPGYMVEGVQTRFLLSFYGNAAKTRPSAVFSDYLNTMLLYMDRPQGWLGSLVNRPARTIYQWVETKQRLPGAFGLADVMAAAVRYRLIPGAPPAPTAAAAYGENAVRIKLDGEETDFSKFPVVAVPFDTRIEVTQEILSIDLSGMDIRRTLTVKAPAELVLKSRTEVEVLRGLVGADFPVTLITPGGKVMPIGTVVQINVTEDGNTTVDTLEGRVQVTSNTGAVKELEAGQSIGMSASGALSAISTCKPTALLAELLPKVELPPIPEGELTSSGAAVAEKTQQSISRVPWWVLFGAVVLLLLVAGTLIWLLRRFPR